MRTALLVYSGITREDDGRLRPGRAAVDDVHGAVRAGRGRRARTTTRSRRPTCSSRARSRRRFDGDVYVLEPGDVAWAGVGCVHGFRNVGDGPVRWLETQAPQPPARHSYRFARDWDYLRQRLDEEELTDDGLVVIGGTAGIGLEVARARAARGDDVVLTGRDAGARGRRWPASSVGGSASRAGARPDRPGGAGRRAGRRRAGRPARGRRDRARREHRRRLRHRPRHPARRAQAGRLHRGRARAAAADAPTTRPSCCSAAGPRTGPTPARSRCRRSTAAWSAWSHALALELAPIRVNALHPGIVGDSPFWSGKPPACSRATSRAPRPAGWPRWPTSSAAVDFLLENPGVNARQPRRRRRLAGHVTAEPRAPSSRSSAPAGWAPRWPAGWPRPGTGSTVYNRTRGRADEVAARSRRATWPPTAREAAAAADVVVVSLADDAAVRAAYGGADGLVAGLGPGTVVADTSTVAPATVRELAGLVAATGARPARHARSPGSVAERRGAATLLVMAGGDAADARAGPAGAGVVRRSGSSCRAARCRRDHEARRQRAGVRRSTRPSPRRWCWPSRPGSTARSPTRCSRPARSPRRSCTTSGPPSSTRSGAGRVRPRPGRQGPRPGRRARRRGGRRRPPAATNRRIVGDAIAAGRGGEDMSALAEHLRGSE